MEPVSLENLDSSRDSQTIKSPANYDFSNKEVWWLAKNLNGVSFSNLHFKNIWLSCEDIGKGLLLDGIYEVGGKYIEFRELMRR